MLTKTIELLRNLVAFPALGGESNLPIANYIEQVLKASNIPYHLVPNEAEDKVAIHCRIGPALDGGVILSGHMDVVPTVGQPWTKPPFQLTTEGEKLYARGSTDMKGFNACCLAMIPKMQALPLKKPIYLAFSYDEEVMCQGAPALIAAINETYKETPAYAIIGEPTEMQTVVAEKGIGGFKTIITSSAAHSSQVKTSVSAIEEATYLVQWLLRKMDHLIETGHIDQRFNPPHTTIHVGTIQGGTAMNIIADHCEFVWDVRNIPTDDVADILQDFKAFCQERIEVKKKINSAFTIETSSVAPIVPGLNTREDSDFVKIINQLNGTQQVGSAAFASEAGQYAAGGFEALLCGPGSINRAHKADEFITTGELEECLDFLGKLVEWYRV